MLLNYGKRFLRLLFGLFFYAMGVYLCVQANVGLAPWDAFSMGIAKATGISFGDIVVLSGIAIIAIDFLLREKIGFGTILNAVLIGKFYDLIAWLDILPRQETLLSGIALMLLGQLVIAIASYLYIGAGMGCGPRDTLMVALGKRFSKAPIGLIRGLLEGSLLLIGWLLGAKVGIGTIIAVFGIGVIIEYTFKLLRFDVKGIQHENFIDTIRIWNPKKLRNKEAVQENFLGRLSYLE